MKKIFEEGGVQALYDELSAKDIRGAKMVHANDATRVRRALEIFLDTGVSIAEWFEKPLRPCLKEVDFQIMAKLPSLSELEEKCSQRFDLMLQAGAIEEVKALLKRGLDRSLPVMKAIGVPELGSYIEGKTSLEEASNLAKLHTRQYAKRQLTWFRNRLPKLYASIFNL